MKSFQNVSSTCNVYYRFNCLIYLFSRSLLSFIHFSFFSFSISSFIHSFIHLFIHSFIFSHNYFFSFVSHNLYLWFFPLSFCFSDCISFFVFDINIKSSFIFIAKRSLNSFVHPFSLIIYISFFLFISLRLYIFLFSFLSFFL